MISSLEVTNESRQEERCNAVGQFASFKEKLLGGLATLIVKLLGRTIGYNTILNRIKTLWRPKVVFDLIAMDNMFFLVKFSSIGDYNFTKYEGP